jgi:hypothetical protein
MQEGIALNTQDYSNFCDFTQSSPHAQGAPATFLHARIEAPALLSERPQQQRRGREEGARQLNFDVAIVAQQRS